MSNPTIIRCPNPKIHGRYDTCGAYIGAIEEGSSYFYCGHCNLNFYVHKINGGVIIKQLNKKQKISMDNLLKSIED